MSLAVPCHNVVWAYFVPRPSVTPPCPPPPCSSNSERSPIADLKASKRWHHPLREITSIIYKSLYYSIDIKEASRKLPPITVCSKGIDSVSALKHFLLNGRPEIYGTIAYTVLAYHTHDDTTGNSGPWHFFITAQSYLLHGRIFPAEKSTEGQATLFLDYFFSLSFLMYTCPHLSSTSHQWSSTP